MTARDLARRVLERVAKDGAWATLALDAELAQSNLDERDRRLVSELVYGVLRHRTRIDRAIALHADLKKTPPKVVLALRLAAYQLLFLDRVPAYAAVDDAVKAARAAGGPKLAGFANAVLRKVSTSREPALPTDPLAKLEVQHSLPRWILDELVAAAPPEQLEAIAAAFGEAPPLVARVNTLRTTVLDVTDELREAGATVTPIPDIPGALRLDGAGDPGRSPSFLAGRWTVQDAGAQRVALAARPRAGQTILDACAGVGGKATHLAELSGDAARIDAADLSKTKLGLLDEAQQRLGLTSIRTLVCDLTARDTPLAPTYDVVVLDAPCSGLGVLRRHPDAKWRLLPDTVPRMAQLQRQLLAAIAPRVAPGGTLVYSVCTFTRAEGPEQVKTLLASDPTLRLVEEHRTWPPDADAFYLARIERQSLAR